MEPKYSPQQQKSAGLQKGQRKLLLFYDEILSPSNIFYKIMQSNGILDQQNHVNLLLVGSC
jgi:hypothetical protein